MAMHMDISELKAFAAKFKVAAGPKLKEELKQAVNAIGTEFLTIVQGEIIGRKCVVTGLLVNSFSKGGPDNIWDESNGGLTIDVGSNVEYARYVNDGHHKTPAGVDKRWVPGSFSGKGQFKYSPGAKTGMLLKAGWVNGKHYFEAAIRHVQPIVDKAAEAAVQRWIDQLF
ncbi:MAG: HK97 gp10 family phage protein [Muribaculaceae bacterium]|nr:HK97 gp10 family phage protein [Muribaculaceae bacterium]